MVLLEMFSACCLSVGFVVRLVGLGEDASTSGELGLCFVLYMSSLVDCE